MIHHPFVQRKIMGKSGLFLIYIVLRAITVEGITFSATSQKLPPVNHDTDFAMDDQSLYSPGLVFGSCTSNLNNECSEYCTFAIENRQNVGKPDHLRYCNFSLNDREIDEHGQHRVIHSVTAIFVNTAVLQTYFKDTYRHLAILDFFDCKVKPIKTKKLTDYRVEARFGYVLDVVAHSRESNETIRQVVGIDGTVLRDKDMFPVSSSAIGIWNWNDRLFLEKKGSSILDRRYDGNFRNFVKDWLSYDLQKVKTDYKEKYSVSALQQKFGICTQKGYNIFCEQYDPRNDVARVSINLELPGDAKISAIKVFNLDNGGLVLLLFRCDENVSETSPECSSIADDYFIVKKINAAGAVVGSLPISQFASIVNENYIHFFEGNKGEMCLSQVNTKDYRSGEVTLNVICFEDHDFYPV